MTQEFQITRRYKQQQPPLLLLVLLLLLVVVVLPLLLVLGTSLDAHGERLPHRCWPMLLSRSTHRMAAASTLTCVAFVFVRPTSSFLQAVAGFFKWTRLLHTNNKVWIFIKLHKDVSVLIWSLLM